MYLSPCVEEPLKSKIIKSFVPELRSRCVFFEFRDSYVLYLWTYDVYDIYIYIYIYIYVCMCVYVCVSVCVSVDDNVYIYIYIYILITELIYCYEAALFQCCL